MKRLRLNFLDNLPKVTQLVSERAKIQPSSLDDLRLFSWEEGSWSWACFSLPDHHSKPTGSYSEDRNKGWPQSPAIQLHNLSTPTLSQKDNNVNILILPTSLSLCSQLLASPGKEGMSTFQTSQDGGKIVCLPQSQWPIRLGHVPPLLVCDPFQNLYYNRSKNPLWSRDIFQISLLLAQKVEGAPFGAGDSECMNSRLVLLFLTGDIEQGTFTFPGFGFSPVKHRNNKCLSH